MAYGPIEATFDVYDDFVNYKSGMYKRAISCVIIWRVRLCDGIVRGSGISISEWRPHIKNINSSV